MSAHQHAWQSDATAAVSTKRRDLGPLRALLPYLGAYKKTIALALGSLSIAALAVLSLPVAVRQAVDLGFTGGADMDRHFLMLAAITAVLAGFSAARFYFVSWLGERIVADLRTAVFRHVLHMSPEFFEVTSAGAVLSRLTADTTLVQTVVGAGLSMALRGTFNFTGGLIMLAVTSPRLTGYLLILLPLLAFPLIFFGRRVRRLSRASQDRLADASAYAGESLHAIDTVQAYNLEARTAGHFAHTVETTFATAVRRIRFRAGLSGSSVMCIFGAVVLIMWLGARSVVDGSMSAGQLSQFVLYAVLVAGASALLSEIWGDLQRAAGAMERLMGLLEIEPEIRSPAVPVTLPLTDLLAVDLVALEFNYPSRPEHHALSDFTLHIAPGETVALVGPSGAGKSTVFKLLLRFYDPVGGGIQLAGHDLRTLDLHDLRGRIGIVPQDTVIFAADVLENVRIGRPGASDKEVLAALRMANAMDFVAQLPERELSFLGERGVRLSGGQRQRIAIARALLKDAPILLLDEATSALDAESEVQIQEALRELVAQRTTVVIAHRLATIKQADRIVVMNDGRIDAVGTHDELWAAGGLYARLAELQFGMELEPRDG